MRTEMFNRMASKALRLARGTALALGAAVMLALVFGVATTAMGANGKPFLLGKANVATLVSTLVKQGPGPALSLRVGAGQPPLTVNSPAKVANLNADTVDGLSSEQFANGVGGKATDAAKLDGKDSSQFMAASTYQLQSPFQSGENIGNGTGIHVASYQCDPGDTLLSGGYRWAVNATSVAVVGNYPWYDTWRVEWANTANTNQPYEMRVYVRCADTAAPAHG